MTHRRTAGPHASRAVRVTALGLLLLGCSGGSGPDQPVCPAIGWSTTLVVELGPTAGRVPSGLEFCVASTCASLEELTGDGARTGPVEGASATGSAVELSLADAYDVVEVRERDELGAVRAGRRFVLDWSRTGGSEECGGPRRAVVRL